MNELEVKADCFELLVEWKGFISNFDYMFILKFMVQIILGYEFILTIYFSFTILLYQLFTGKINWMIGSIHYICWILLIYIVDIQCCWIIDSFISLKTFEKMIKFIIV